MEKEKNYTSIMIRLESELDKFKPEIVIKNDSLIKNYNDIEELLKITNKDDQTQCIYINRNKIQKILFDEDTIIKINNENINYEGIKSLFYFACDIMNDRYVLNYSYDIHFINDLYEKIKKEENNLKKLLLYIILDIIFDNYKQLSNSTESDETEKIYEEIKNHINQNLSLLNEFELNIKPINEDIIDIEEIFIKIIIFLYRNKKFDNIEYTSRLLEILDMQNIELTYKMYESIKKEFNENSSKEYLDNYKIKSQKDLDNDKIIDFYYIQLKYIFKYSIYLYNIQFLLDSRNYVKQIINSDYSILKNLLNNNNLNNIEKKKLFVLKTLLDSEYYTSNKDKLLIAQLNEILNYYKNFHQKEMDKIKEINEIIEKQDKKKAEKFMNEYDKAKKKNKRLKFYKYIYELQLTTNKKFEDFNKVVSFLDRSEQSIHDKKINLTKIKYREEIFNFFNDEKNNDYIKEIFEQDEIDSFKKIYKIYYIVRIYFKNYLFETNKRDIEKIELTIENKEKYELDQYLECLDLNEIKKKNHLYLLISKLYSIDNNTKTEKYVESKVKDWEDLKNLFEDKKYDLVQEETKMKLYIFFNNEKNKELHKEILDEEKYNFLLEKKAEAEEEIINYYKKFYPESKKDVIENKKFEDKDYDINLKKIKLREPIIFSLFGEKIDLKEEEFSEAIKKWDKIERDINNKHYNNLNENDRKKIIKFFEKKDDETNKFIKEIFTEEIIESFIKENLKNKDNNTGKSATNKGKFGKKKFKKEKYDLNNDMQDSINIETSTKSKTSKRGQSILETSEYHIKEESSEKYEDIIIKSNLKITMTLKNKSIEVNDIQIDESGYNINYLKNMKEKVSNESNSFENKIFNILDDLKKLLIEQYTNNFKLVIELIFEKQNLYNIDFSLKYKVWLINSIPNKDGSPITMQNEVSKILSDDNIVHNDFKNLINEINKPKYSKISKKEENNLKIITKEINNPQTSSNSHNNQGNDSTQNRNSNNNDSHNAITLMPIYNGEEPTPSKIENKSYNNINSKEKPKKSKYRIISYEKVIGSHFEYRRNNTVEFLKELASGEFVSVGSDKRVIKIYDKYAQEIKNADIPEIRDYIYDICEKKISDETYILACANKEIYTLKITPNGGLKVENNWELPNMTCTSSLIISLKEKVVKVQKGSKKKNKNNSKIEQYIDKDTNLVVVAGRNGVKCLVDILGGKNKEFDSDSFNIVNEDTYRGLHKMSETRIAMTSNSIIQGGKNKLIIYNFASKDNKNTSEIKGNKRGDKEFEIENYSFIASNTGMASLSEEGVLLCACKKYTKDDKNGILLVTIADNEKNNSIIENNKPKWEHKFKNTDEFEVHCFCFLSLLKDENNPKIVDINDFNDHNKKKDIFLVGGFDSKLGEGRIRLYTFVRKDNKIKDIKFLQDVEIQKTAKMDIESRIEQKKTVNIKVFNGAISCLIQSSQGTDIKNKIIASCYDGRVYLLSEPNLAQYNQ